MSKNILFAVTFLIISAQSMAGTVASYDSNGDSELVIQSMPCKGVPDGHDAHISADNGQSVNLTCHHFLPQQQQ